MNRFESCEERLRTLMDETVLEVFATMLGCKCIPTQAADARPDVTALIRFSGALAGKCVLIFAEIDATKLAEMLFGGAADDAMTADAMGELCNVLAGGWKRRLRPPACGSGLSVPSVARGRLDLPTGLCASQCYGFDGGQFAVRLSVDEITEE